jgi:hypothetical protein
MTNSLFIFFAVILVLLSPVIGWVICQAKARSLMSVYLSPVQLRILDWQAKKPSKWAVFTFLVIVLPNFLPKPISPLVWITFGTCILVKMIFQFSRPCADLPKMDFPHSFIRQLAYLRRMGLGFIFLSFMTALALIVVCEFMPVMKP